MALTQITTSGLANGAVTSDKISNTVQLGGPTITQIQITDSNYDVLDDTAVSTSGGYIKITGAGFNTGAVVIVGSVNATSTTFVNSTSLNVQVPAAVAGTYVVYVVNTDGGTAIAVNGLTYSGTPTWVTGSSLSTQYSNVAISIQLSATGDTPLTYSLADGNTLPSGLTLTSGGLLSGTVNVGANTTYSFTVNAIDPQLQDSPRAFTLPVNIITGPSTVETLVVAGGGAGGGTSDSCAGGGGAGGLLYGTSIAVVAGTTYTITVGAGAAGSGLVGANGSNSSIVGGSLTMTALGGGGGGGGARGSFTNNGQNGGSGGGGGAFPSSSGSGGTKTQGNSGGATGYGNNGGSTVSTTQPGGGGGAGEAGNTDGQGQGGDGLEFDISGTNTYYAGGGGASYTGLIGGLGGGGTGAPSSQGNGGNGSTNTGGGGGGSYSFNTGGSGGSGIVIIRYSNIYDAATATTGSPTISNTGGYRIYKFTGSGSITF